MTPLIKYIYNYLNYKPEVGILSAVGSYIIAMKSVMLTDEGLKIVATISACAACIVSCLTAMSWLIRAIVWCGKMWTYLKLRIKK
ncbi:hypothetical protein [Mucilaginibacter koreensis]